MLEIWKDIPNCDGYQISNTGKVRHIKETILKPENRPIKKNSKYCQSRVTIKGKKYAVHRLVAQAFIPNPNNLPQVNHIDGNPQNNEINNLEWCSPKENVRHAIKTGLRKLKIPLNKHKYICDEYKKGKTINEIANEFKVQNTCIRDILIKNNIKRRKRGKNK